MSDFKEGSKVRHKASGEEGIVIYVQRRCVTKGHGGPVGCLSHQFKDCDKQPTGLYQISYGFDKVATVSEHVLEEIQ